VSSEADELSSVDVSVIVAFAAGFVKANDFHGPVRDFVTQISLIHWPELRDMRAAAHVACEEVGGLQQATARVVMEKARYEEMVARSRDGGGREERLRRQQVRLERALTRMHDSAAIVAARMEQQAL
jgi:hypothetical protein